jgi:hypothetical protein
VTGLLAAGAVVCGHAGSAGAEEAPAVRHLPEAIQIVVLPSSTSLDELAAVPGMSLGLMSTGVGDVPREQTYLDISQGNRMNESLYDDPLPPLRSTFLRVPGWSEIVRRADAAPADIVPGLLGSALLDAGIRPAPVPSARTAAIIVADRSGEIGRVVGGPPGVVVFAAGVGTMRELARVVPTGGLTIAFAEPEEGRETVPIGIRGAGFRGNLTSDSTRTDGYVLSTDIAPTILDRFGLPVRSEMDGEPIRAEGAADAEAVRGLGDRMAAIPDRREPVVVGCLGAWTLIALVLSRVAFRLRRVAMAWLALCFAYMPVLLLVGAWLEPSAAAEGLLVGLGAAGLAALTVRFGSGWRGLAIACAITLAAYAIDVIAGSGLTRLSLLGPNPIFGARFYGIGNELEALFAVMVPVGVAAGLSAFGGRERGVSRRAAIAAFLIAGVVGAVVFGAGRFGADVGGAIVLPVGAVVAAATLPADVGHFPSLRPGNRSRSSWPRLAAAIVFTAFFALAVLALIDLVSGGDSHLTRSIIHAGGASNLADVAQRRQELSADDFSQAAENPLFWIVVVGIALALIRWRRIDTWLDPSPIARAGLIGACAAVAVGVLVNDSGATFLVLGALALGAFLAYAWAQSGGKRGFRRNARALGG